MTFWQSVVISLIAHAVSKGRDGANANRDATEWSKQAQSFLICLEMFAFSIVHCFVFPTDEWEPGYREKEKRRIKASFGDTLALKDFVHDVKTVIRSKKKHRKEYRKVDPSKSLDLSKSSSSDGADDDGNLDKHVQTALIQDLDGVSQFELGDPDSDHEEDVGWSRIEEFIDVIEEGSNLHSDNDVEQQSRTNHPHEVI